jgi:hypothetical protein
LTANGDWWAYGEHRYGDRKANRVLPGIEDRQGNRRDAGAFVVLLLGKSQQ